MPADKWTSCILCNSSRLKVLKGFENNYLIQCESCGLVFCRQRPSTEELTAHYNRYQRGQGISPITLKRYDELLDYFEPFRVQNNILDVGCGDGHFLERAALRGWQVFGIEYTDEAIRIGSGKGITMSRGPLNAHEFQESFFDVVTSFVVIEHINTPVQELESMNAVLRSGGLIYITTPNFNSLSRYLAGPRWNLIEYPEHLTYFTRRTLKKLFRMKMYDIRYIKTAGISFGRLRDSLGNASRMHHDEGLREKIEVSPLLKLSKRMINSILDVTSLGDGIKACFVKP